MAGNTRNGVCGDGVGMGWMLRERGLEYEQIEEIMGVAIFGSPANNLFGSLAKGLLLLLLNSLLLHVF